MSRNSRFVYHGTNEKHLKSIRETGLLPRTVGKSNYSGAVASHPDYLYLSNTRALIYAMAANGRRRLLLLEIPLERLDESLCYPDEDSIALRGLMDEGTYESADHDARFNELHRTAVPENQQLEWRSYFEQFGNIAYRGRVPFEAVSRFALIDEGAMSRLILPLLARFQPAATNIANLLDYQAGAIAFIFDAANISGIPDDEMRTLRIARLSSVALRVPR